MVGSISKTSPHNIEVLERRYRALELRKAGLSYRDISRVIQVEYNVGDKYDERKAWNDVDDRLRDFESQVRESAGQILQIELERLDQMLSVCMNKALGGDMKAVDRVLSIMSRRSRYLGLDKPSEYKIHDWRVEIIDLIKSGKLTIEQVRQELPDELYKQIVESGGISLLEVRTAKSEGAVIEGDFVAGESST